MTQIAHIRNVDGTWELVRRYKLDSKGNAVGRIKDVTGKTLIEMPVIGAIFANDRVVPLTEQTLDTSVSGDVNISEDINVKDVGVVITTLIEDKTQAEIDAKQEAEITEALNSIQENRSGLKALAEGLFIAYNEAREANGKQPITKQQYLTWLRGQL